MTTPSPGTAIQAPSARVPEMSTFDQALDQRRRTQATEGSLANELKQLSEIVLRGPTDKRAELPSSLLSGPSFPSTTAKAETAAHGNKASGEDPAFRSILQTMESYFNHATVSHLLMRSLNQLVSGVTTLLRST
jgi:hypothetical protein